MTLRPDPFTEIREALEAATVAVTAPPADCTQVCDYAECNCSGKYRPLAWNIDMDALKAALARLEREAAERETALAASRSELRELHEAADLNAGARREVSGLRTRVGEVEAERDGLIADGKIAGQWLLGFQARAHAAETTVARQAEALQAFGDLDGPELRHWLGSQDVCGTTFSVRMANAIHGVLRVLASPEAAAAEPPKLTLDEFMARTEDVKAPNSAKRLAWVTGKTIGQIMDDLAAFDVTRDAAALPAVDAPPEPTT